MDLPVSIRTEKVKDTPSQATVVYPVIYNLNNKQAEFKINKAIVQLLNQMLVDRDYYNQDLVELIAYFEIKNNQRGILSLNLIVYSFTGGAHGMTSVKSLTFDTETGKQFTLQELFKPNSSYIKDLSTIITKEINKWDITIIEPFEEIQPNQDFYIADTSLVIYFQLYEIAPYSSGFPYFPIAILEIQDIIQPNGPLDKMITFT